MQSWKRRIKAAREREAGQRWKVPPNPATVANPRHKEQASLRSERPLLKGLPYALVVEPTSGSLEGVSQYRWLCPNPPVPDAGGLEWGPSVRISTESPVGPMPRGPCSEHHCLTIVLEAGAIGLSLPQTRTPRHWGVTCPGPLRRRARKEAQTSSQDTPPQPLPLTQMCPLQCPPMWNVQVDGTSGGHPCGTSCVTGTAPRP